MFRGSRVTPSPLNFEREVIKMSKFNPYYNAGYVGYGMYAQPNDEVIIAKVVCTMMLILWTVITIITTGMMVATDDMMWCIVSSICGASTIFSALACKGLVNVVKNKALMESRPVLTPMSMSMTKAD